MSTKPLQELEELRKIDVENCKRIDALQNKLAYELEGEQGSVAKALAQVSTQRRKAERYKGQALRAKAKINLALKHLNDKSKEAEVARELALEALRDMT